MGDGERARGKETERGKQKRREEEGKKSRGGRSSTEESRTEGAKAFREGRSPRTRGMRRRSSENDLPRKNSTFSWRGHQDGRTLE